ncbi:hypothetical protein [Trebonia sp.]|uniref:hypothetical protein n=1 Tax=Trebonia sp. TaxID=2767075 RepID=UPI0026342F4D|nr:hypothetical protein [Trebonia sp.]
MLTALIALVIAAAAFALFLFVLVVVGIHAEPPYQELASHAASPIARLTRRLLGVYVRRTADAKASDDREECLAGPAADWRHTDGEGR